MSINKRRKPHAFTLIEMIGVLAIVAILASLLIPKIFESINNSRLSQAQLGYQTIKTAVLEHYGKFLAFNSSNGVSFALATSGDTMEDYDKILLAEGLVDKPLFLKISNPSTIRIRNISGLDGNSTAGPHGNGSSTGWGYDLSGDTKNDVVGQYVVEAMLSNVTEADAIALNDRLDGPALGQDPSNGSDFLGRVVYFKDTGQPSGLTVFIYITHR